MYVESLEITKRPNYDQYKPGHFAGTVCLKEGVSEQRIELSATAISAIFRVISEEVQATAKTNAKAVSAGMAEAIAGPLLESAAQIPDLS